MVLPEISRVELPNGLVLHLLEDHTLPKVQGFALIRVGDRYEPADLVGLASIVGQTMRTGGTTTRSGDEINETLANVGASVETGIGESSGTASLFALREDFPLALEILADLLRHPVFPEEKIDLAKVRMRSAIARRNDDVAGIADREFFKLLYGESSPYARTMEYATIDRITRDDVIAFHERYFHPNQISIGLWGDFEPAAAQALVEKHFGSWERKDVSLPPPPPVTLERKPSIHLIAKKDVNQTNLRVGHLGGRLDDPDYFATSLMAEILGGGFSSRLFKLIRSDQGLAYRVRASWEAEWDRPGAFVVVCNTKSETTLKATTELLRQIRRLTEEPVSEQELKLAKDGILNSFVFNFDSSGELVRRVMTYEYYGYPKDFLETYRSRVEQVTSEDILRAARKNIWPDSLVLLAVGREEDFDGSLSTLGEVQTIDITIPKPQEVAPRH
jgi:zinc protease